MERRLERRLSGRCLPPPQRGIPVPRTTRSPRLPFLALLLSLLLALTACGGSSAGGDAAASSSSGGAFPVTVTGDNGDLKLDAQPEKIASMSATAPAMLYSIGAHAQGDAVDSNANDPGGGPTTDLSSFTPNAEAIAKYDPDLVVLS